VIALGSTPAEFKAAIDLRRSKMAAMVKLIGRKLATVRVLCWSASGRRGAVADDARP
jgi:hypothetical protein